MTHDNESWAVEIGGDMVEKCAKAGFEALSPKDRLVYWFWWADYMMRNAGDFANAVVLERDFQLEIASHAKELGLSYTKETFSLPRAELEKQYFDRFDAVCGEIRNGCLAERHYERRCQTSDALGDLGGVQAATRAIRTNAGKVTRAG